MFIKKKETNEKKKRIKKDKTFKLNNHINHAKYKFKTKKNYKHPKSNAIEQYR